MSGFYSNETFTFDYKKPYLIITIKKLDIKDEDLNISERVLAKFYKTKSNGEPIKFGYIFNITVFGYVDISKMQKVGSMFNRFRSLTQKQVYGSAVVIDNHFSMLIGIVQKLLDMFNNDRPVKFVTNMEDGYKFVDNLMKDPQIFNKNKLQVN